MIKRVQRFYLTEHQRVKGESEYGVNMGTPSIIFFQAWMALSLCTGICKDSEFLRSLTNAARDFVKVKYHGEQCVILKDIPQLAGNETMSVARDKPRELLLD